MKKFFMAAISLVSVFSTTSALAMNLEEGFVNFPFSVCEVVGVDASTIEGTPVFNIEKWGDEYYFDVSQEFITCLSKDKLCIKFNEDL